MKPEKIKIIPRWSKSKEDIWKEAFADLEDVPLSKKIRHISLGKYAAVILLAIILTGTIISQSYSVTQIAERGSHLLVTLPDGSRVNLNADSRLTYKPYRWFVSRNVELEGEAFFEVKQGKRFSVKSNQNKVNVLGTSFNVFSRPDKYRVTCLTGKVQVATLDKVTTLDPNMQLTYHDSKLTIEKNIHTSQSVAWIENKFVFEGVPLVEVINEIERQYDIRVKADIPPGHVYTGNFSRATKPDMILEIIGKPFGIKFSIE